MISILFDVNYCAEIFQPFSLSGSCGFCIRLHVVSGEEIGRLGESRRGKCDRRKNSRGVVTGGRDVRIPTATLLPGLLDLFYFDTRKTLLFLQATNIFRIVLVTSLSLQPVLGLR